MINKSLEKILNKQTISNEFELEHALILERKLRLLTKENPELVAKRESIRNLIKKYEKEHWNKDSVITEEKINESDVAEIYAEKEREFLLSPNSA
jgi:hypothetical protein